MEHTHPNVTQRKGETLPGEEITHDNLPAETTALPNTSQPLGISQAQLNAQFEAFTDSIGQMMRLQINTMFSDFESRWTAQIEHDASSRGSGRSRTSSEVPSQTSHDDDDVPPEGSREVGEGEDDNDEEDPPSVGGSESSPSNEQGASNTQQHSHGGGNGGDPPDDDEDAASKKKKKKKKRQSLFKDSAGKDDALVHHIQAGGDSLTGRKRRNPPGKDLKELGSEIYTDSSSEQPITEELLQKVYDLVMEHVERPIALPELETTSDLFLFNHGVNLNEEYGRKILNEGLQPQATDVGERMRLKYLSHKGGGKAFSVPPHTTNRDSFNVPWLAP